MTEKKELPYAAAAGAASAALITPFPIAGGMSI